MTGTSLMKEQWLCTNQGNKITKTLLQPNMEGWNEIALPTVKFKFRQSGGGRKVIAPALHSIAWLLYRCCVSMKARLPRSLFFFLVWARRPPQRRKCRGVNHAHCLNPRQNSFMISDVISNLIMRSSKQNLWVEVNGLRNGRVNTTWV